MSLFHRSLLFIPFFACSLNGTCQEAVKFFSSDTATVGGKKYIGKINDQGFVLTDSKGTTILKQRGEFFLMEFRDFNSDGYKDIFLDHGGNTPETYSILVYMPSTRLFRELKGLEQFPDPKAITGTPYFYSYHKSGCADADWDSDLFYIKNFKAIRLGNISGRGCNDNGVPGSIFIFKIGQEKKTLLSTLPIDAVAQYRDKWEYIEKYWNGNYRKFKI